MKNDKGYQYVVMRQVGNGTPTEASWGVFDNFSDAERDMEEKQHDLNNMISEGVRIRTDADVEAALQTIADAKKTRYYVARRLPGPWEETNSWDE
jgi:hypothetical protein